MEAHGEIKLEWQNDLLITHVKGPFNQEGSIVAIRLFRESIQAANLTTWYRLELWDAETMGTPDAMSNSSEVYEWSLDHGCRGTAVVVQGVFLTSVAQKFLPDSVKIFSDQNDALAWLNNQRI